MIKTKLIIVLLLLVGITISTQQNDFPKLTGPYLGQKPPGKTPEIFAPGIISLEGRYELNSEFSLDGDEFYFELSTTTPKEKKKGQYFYVIMVSKRINGVWTKPEMVPFSGEYATMDFCFSPDGKRMYFTSDRPNEYDSEPKNNIWYVERKGDGWSEPVILGPPVYRSEVRQGQHSLAANGTLYFRSGDDLFCSNYSDGKFIKPVKLPDTINSPYPESKPYVASDESFLLFVRYAMPEFIDGGKGLYISFRREDGSWTQAQNTNILGSLPKFSPDGRYFFFSRGGDIYWVDANVIYDLKPDTSLPEQRLWSGAEDLYDVILKSGPNAARERFEEIKSDKRFDFIEKEFLDLGNKLRSYGRVEKAIQFLDLAKELFPDSSEY